MEFANNADFWIGLLKIIWINIILSGDNAVVIALAARSLPPHQQKKAVLFGSGAAVVLRIVLTAIAALLLPLLAVLVALSGSGHNWYLWLLTAVAGSSDVFLGGWIAYSNRMKESELGVAVELIEREGADTIAAFFAEPVQGEPLRVTPERRLVAGGEDVTLDAILQDATFKPLSGADVRGEITGPGGALQRFVFAPGGAGAYRATVPSPGEGRWQVSVRATRDGREVGRARNEFVVEIGRASCRERV